MVSDREMAENIIGLALEIVRPANGTGVLDCNDQFLAVFHCSAVLSSEMREIAMRANLPVDSFCVFPNYH